MKISEFEKLKELIRNYIQLLEKEYSVISEILSFNMDSFSAWEEMRMWYIRRLEQIRELVDRNSDFLKTVEQIESALCCSSSGLDSMYGRDLFANAEQRNQERESFISVLDSLEVIDDDDDSAVADAKATASGIATSMSEALIDVLLAEQEKSAQRRKQLADALKKGEPVIISPDGQIVDISTADAIAALRAQLAGGGETMVNAHGTIFNPSVPFAQSGFCNRNTSAL